ncbi:hypothetical protein DPMN_124315 [Dreissena polymorpha]|uniref:Uncharacterized protein n=1 Tax=Dreissena polymorpha TaxID=45954 RepID=A0A9D4EX54_DREPO|nr:hypothetical protein DPMN_166487 [Dreissena polymorpha]KAH3822531.1 hypothetical protein DPMN_124315 [Dreissena polymorpha]
MFGDGLTESCWRPSWDTLPVTCIGSTPPRIRQKLTSCRVLRLPRRSTRDYRNRAYSAFRCFFIRHGVPPEVNYDDSE